VDFYQFWKSLKEEKAEMNQSKSTIKPPGGKEQVLSNSLNAQVASNTAIAAILVWTTVPGSLSLVHQTRAYNTSQTDPTRELQGWNYFLYAHLICVHPKQ
jgi:cytochrome c oxidase assembly factor CtaG